MSIPNLIIDALGSNPLDDVDQDDLLLELLVEGRQLEEQALLG